MKWPSRASHPELAPPAASIRSFIRPPSRIALGTGGAAVRVFSRSSAPDDVKRRSSRGGVAPPQVSVAISLLRPRRPRAKPRACRGWGRAARSRSRTEVRPDLPLGGVAIPVARSPRGQRRRGGVRASALDRQSGRPPLSPGSVSEPARPPHGPELLLLGGVLERRS